MKTPTSVKFISIFYLLEGILGLILGGLLFMGGAAITLLIPVVGPVIMIVAGILMLIGIFNFIVYGALRKGRSWARIYAILIAMIGLVSAFVNGAFIILTAFNIIVLYFLLFDKTTVRYFK